MNFANVVPIRRMPAHRPWLTYSVPDTFDISPGSLVSMPLRGKPHLGIVWSIHQFQPAIQTQALNAVYLSSPIMSAWQLRACEIVADRSSTSLGDIVWKLIPKISNRNLIKISSHELINRPDISQAHGSVLWYRDRREVFTKIQEIIGSQLKCPVCIITPTVNDAEEISSLVEAMGRLVVHVHSHMPPSIYAEWYERIRSGQPIVAVGNISAVLLPYTQTPIIILDQEEHHAHKQTSQSPYYDSREVLRSLNLPLHITTPAPSLTLFQQQSLIIPHPPAHRILVSLHGPKPSPLFSEQSLDILDAVQSQNRTLVCITPRRGYASITTCRSCGTNLTCPTCARNITIFRGPADEARCRSCQTSIALSFHCQKCGSSDWSFHGYGIEQTVSALQKLRPNLTIAPLVRPDVPVDIAVDTYQAYLMLRKIKRLGAIVVTSGDSLLTAPDFSIAERAWQFLARMQTEAPAIPVVVQTFEPESLFWQRWLHGDDQTWYQDELQQRERFNVPPFAQQWIISFRGNIQLVKQKEAELRTMYPRQLTIQPLPLRASTIATHRLLLTFIDVQLVHSIPWMILFPLPWHIDKHPTSWLD